MTIYAEILTYICAISEKNGKTLHLLKAGSKLAPSGRSRRKVELLGTFGEYTESKKKPVSQTHMAAPNQNAGQINSGGSIMSFMAPAPSNQPAQAKGKDAKMNGK